MRRALILLLALVLGLGPALAAAPSSTMELAWTALTGLQGSRLPVCCRRGGRHHCTEMSSGEAEAGVGGVLGTSVSANDRCPYSSRVLASAVAPLATLASSEVGLKADSQGCKLQAAEASVYCRVGRNQSPRGPPAVEAA